MNPSAVRPLLRDCTTSPVGDDQSSFVQGPPCSSLCAIGPAGSLVAEKTSLNSVSRALPSFSPTFSAAKAASVQANSASPPAPSAFRPPSTCFRRSPSITAGPASSPTPNSSPCHPCSSPISSSAFSRSLAASCISQSISQSMARQNSALEQAQTQEASSPCLRLQSTSPTASSSQETSSLAAQQGATQDGYLQQKWPSSPSSTPFSHASLLCRNPSPVMNLTHHQTVSPSPHPSFPNPRSSSTQNVNNNNNFNITSGSRSAISYINNGGTAAQKIPLTNGTHESLWVVSHNRVAHPFSASEPCSRVQSPSPSSTPVSFSRLCSPLPQHNYSSPMANKPPHPWTARGAGAGFCNPLGLTLELSRSSSVSSGCPSPQILSPPPIGVSVHAWANNIASPQPRNAKCTSSSTSTSLSSSLCSPTPENGSFDPPSSLPLRSCRASSPVQSWSHPSQPTAEALNGSLSFGPTDASPSPLLNRSGGLHHSWVDRSATALGFNGSGTLEQQEQQESFPKIGWSFQSNSASCLKPQTGLQSSFLPKQGKSGKNDVGGHHLPDPQASLSTTSSPCVFGSRHSPIPSFPGPSESQADLEERNCRSQLICAYVSRPVHEESVSSSFMNCPSLSPFHPQAQIQLSVTTPPLPSVPPSPTLSPPQQSSGQSSTSKQRNQRSSYATTVNLQIGGSGQIKSFSTAQVSLTQTLQGGASAGGPGQGQTVRRVSINGFSHLPSTLPQN